MKITSICFGCGSQSHKFDGILNSKSIALKLESFQEMSQADETPGFSKDNKSDLQDADWIDV